MSRSLRWMFLALLSASACGAAAQPQGDGQRQPSNGGPSGGPDRQRYHKDGRPSDGGYIDQWLDMLRSRNPEEFEKMRKLREENPDEFHRLLRQRLQDMRMKFQPGGSLNDHPKVMEALKNLPPEDRDWVMQRLQSQPGGGYMGSPGMGFDRRGGLTDLKRVMTPEIARAEEKTRELSRKYRAAQNDQERDAVLGELRANLGEQFDLTEKARGDQLRQIEEKIPKLRQQLEDRLARRDELIETRLKEVIAGDGPRH